MKATVFLFLLKQIIKYFKDHPNLIPGEVDNKLINFLAAALGV